MKLLQERVSKATGLEETVRRQELVIERLEARFQTYMQEKRARGTFNDLDRSFLAEHAVLGLDREEFPARDRMVRTSFSWWIDDEGNSRRLQPPGGSAAQSRVKFSDDDPLQVLPLSFRSAHPSIVRRFRIGHLGQNITDDTDGDFFPGKNRRRTSAFENIE